MLRKKHVENEVERTMELLGEDAPLKADAFFFTRLQARIREEEAAHHFLVPSLWQRWRPMVLAALVGVNIITAALWLVSGSTNSAREQGLNALAEDYALVSDIGDWLYESLGE
ncbi:hypothetical protein KAR48_19700 [bacterium]|nr:hypothetical protein [bacterium]